MSNAMAKSAGTRISGAMTCIPIASAGSWTARSAEPAFKFNFDGIPLPVDRFAFAQSESFATRARLDLPVYTSGRIGYGIAAGEANAAAAGFDLANAALDLRLHVAEEYTAVLRAQRGSEVAESRVRSLAAHVRDAELLFQHDQIPRTDLLAAQVALANARQGAIQARHLLDVSRAVYNRRLGRPLSAPVHIAELPVEAPAEDLDTLTARALRTHPALASLSSQALALRQQAAGVLARNGLQATLRGEYSYEQNKYRIPEGIAAAGIGVTWNVFDSGRNRHEAAALSQRSEGVVRLRADLESTIAVAIYRALLEVEETRKCLEVTPQAIEQAEETLRSVRKRFASGLGTGTEVLDAETLRVRAYHDHYGALYDAVMARLRLRHATGELGRSGAGGSAPPAISLLSRPAGTTVTVATGGALDHAKLRSASPDHRNRLTRPSIIVDCNCRKDLLPCGLSIGAVGHSGTRGAATHNDQLVLVSLQRSSGGLSCLEERARPRPRNLPRLCTQV
jgi:outer membrane protein TolC